MKKYLNSGFNLTLVLYAIVSPISTSALYIFSGMMVIFGIGLLMKKKAIEINKITIILFIAFFAWGGFTTIFSGNYFFGDVFNNLWEYLPVILLPIFFQASDVKKEKIVIALLISSSVICLFGIIQYFFPAVIYPLPRQLARTVFGNRIFFGFFHNQNPAASFFSMITIIAFSLLLFWNIGKKHKIALLIFFGLTLTAVILTISRNAFISIFTIFIIILFFKNRRWFVCGITIFVVFLIIILSFSNPVSSRLKTLTDNKSHNNSARIEMWKIAIELFRDHPVAGIGKRNWEKVLTERKNNPQKWTFSSVIDVLGHPHNIYLQLLAETGIIGLLLFIAFWGNIVQLLYLKNIQMSKGSFESAFIKGVLGVLGNLFLSNMFDSFLDSLWILLLLSFLVGIALGGSNSRIKEIR
ncbi:MAG: O-antigen ligase family protein [Candidatus Desantisbacteria bacterium]